MTKQRIGVIDCDFVAFRVAAACENSCVVVKHKESGSTKEFKNKTEFKGRAKKTIGGWLGDHNTQRIEKGKEPFSLDDFEITEKYIAQPKSAAIHSIKHMLMSFKKHLGLTKSILLVGQGKTFRHNLPLPTQYKADRADLHKPILLDDMKKYLMGRDNTEIVTGIEADDRLSHYMYMSHQHYKECGYHNYVAVSIDKDNMQTYGEIFNPAKDYLGEWSYPETFIIDGHGELYRDPKGKVRGQGDMWLYFQMMNGDDTDGYNPTKPFGIRCGEVTVYDHLKDCTNEKEALEKLVEAYSDWFPKGVEYTSWCGKEMKITPVEYLQLITDCAFMQRFPDDRYVVAEKLDKHGIIYDK